MRLAFISLILPLLLGACGSARETEPGRTATEQLLFSVAAERAADKLAFRIAPGAKVFVDATYVEGTDSKYLLSAIRDHILRRGGALVDDKAHADLVIEPRVGAMSIDRGKTRVGTPDFGIPIPLAGDLHIPEFAFYKRDTQQGVVKVAATSYSAKSGKLIQSLDPVYGFSELTESGALLFFSWTTNDLVPDGPQQQWVGD